MYQRFDQQLGEEGAADLSMLTEFMRDWYAESTRWVDAMLKVVLAESAENREQIQAWVDTWEPRAYAALQPLAEAATGQAALDEVRAALLAIKAEAEPEIAPHHPQPGRSSAARPWGEIVARTFKLKG